MWMTKFYTENISQKEIKSVCRFMNISSYSGVEITDLVKKTKGNRIK